MHLVAEIRIFVVGVSFFSKLHEMEISPGRPQTTYPIMLKAFMNNPLPVILSVVHFVFERMVKIVKVMMYVIFMVM